LHARKQQQGSVFPSAELASLMIESFVWCDDVNLWLLLRLLVPAIVSSVSFMIA
jgi:hypothetical protein